MKLLFYKLIYHPSVNRVLRFLNKKLAFATSFRLPPSGTFEVDVPGARTFKMATNQTSYVTRLLYYEGAQAFEYTPIFMALIKNINTFIDVGANTGYYSLLAAANSTASIYAFEPSAGPLHYLSLNITLNSFEDRIKVVSLALNDQRGELDFFSTTNSKYKELKHNLGGVGSLKKNQAASSIQKVTALSLDEFVSSELVRSIDLIKIDTEGTEHFILRGASECITKFQPIIICETLFNKIEKEIEDEMTAHGYLFFNHVKGTLVQVQTLTRNIDNGVRDCFMVHPSKLAVIEKFVIK